MGIQEDKYYLKNQGYDDEKIKAALLQKGYPKNDVDSAFEEKNHHKILVPLVIILVLIVGFNIFYFTYLSKEHYSDNPEKWIIEEESSSLLDVEQATKGEAYVDSVGEQQYKSLSTMFSQDGYYQGKLIDFNHPYMKVTNNMTPGDGVIEGYILERVENEILYSYIFVDSDWKNNLPNSVIMWGKGFEINQSFNFENEVSSGVYMNKIQDSEDRLLMGASMRSGGVMVGEENTFIILN